MGMSQGPRQDSPPARNGGRQPARNGSRQPARKGSQRLDRRRWAEAGLQALAEGGPDAVAVEPVARRLGATKGSFYWHFGDRQELLAGALELYEQVATDQVIAELGQLPDPKDQLARIFARVFAVEGGDPVYHSLLAHAEDPLIAPTLQRITRRRLEYLTTAMTSAGYPPPEATHRAVLAYTTWLGLVQSERAAGGRLFRSKAGRERYLTFLYAVILGPAPDI